MADVALVFSPESSPATSTGRPTATVVFTANGVPAPNVAYVLWPVDGDLVRVYGSASTAIFVTDNGRSSLPAQGEMAGGYGGIFAYTANIASPWVGRVKMQMGQRVFIFAAAGTGVIMVIERPG